MQMESGWNMDKLEDIKAKLKKMISEYRYTHSLMVMEASADLAGKYGADVEKAALAGLVHDCAKGLDEKSIFALCDYYGIIVDNIMKEKPDLMHGIIGSRIAREQFGIEDEDVLTAIADHTMGRAEMDKLSCVVFVADYIEATRDFPGVEDIRKAAQESLEKAILVGLDNTILHILKKGEPLHPQTILTRNWALKIDRREEQA